MSRSRWMSVAALLFGLAIVPARAQDFQKAFSVGEKGRINISSVSGDISVQGYDGQVVQVSAYREGRDRNLVEIVDESGPNEVSLSVRYAQTGGVNASVRFVVEVPRGHSYSFDALRTASGDVEVTGVAGEIKVKTASGDVALKQVSGNITVDAASGDVSIEDASGIANAHTASGDVQASFARIEGSGPMSFSTASGDVTVRVPGTISANVQVSTASGSVKSDFPLSLDERGKKGSAVLGSGALSLKISTASGDVNLLRY